LAEEVNHLLSHELTKYISDEKLNILGEPLPNKDEPAKIDFDKDEDFEFVFDLGLSPEIAIDFEKAGEIPYYEIKVDDELVEHQIEGYANRFGENIPAEQIGEKETTVGDFIQLGEDGNVLEGGISANNVQVSIQLIRDEEIKAGFIGAKVGEVIKFNPKTAFANDHEVAHMLKIKQEEVESVNSEFNFTINKINTFIPAEVNEALIKKVYGEETEIKSVEEFREKISAELLANLRYSSEYRFLIDVKDKLTKYVSMQLPEEFLKRWLAETNEKVTAEQIEQEFGNFRKDLEWNLIKSKLFKENGLKVTEEDIRAMASEMAMMQFRQYGMFNVPQEYLDNYANSILKNEEEKHRMSEKKVEDKVLSFVKEKAGIKTIRVSQKEFDDLFEK
jgi:trigger factor